MADPKTSSKTEEVPAEPKAAPSEVASVAEAAAEPVAEEPAAAPEEAPAAPSNNKYVLVAEDDRFYARIYETKLGREGFDVKVVTNGEEALAAIKERVPHLIVLDLMMPIKDGFDTLKELKQSEKYKNIPVIVISNLGQNEDVQQAMTLGASDYFIKANLSIEEMVAKVKKNIA